MVCLTAGQHWSGIHREALKVKRDALLSVVHLVDGIAEQRP